MKLTYYGHSCFSVECKGRHLLFDPFISPNPLAAQVKMESIRADYILITHAHQDHLADAVKLAKQTGAKVVTNYEIAQWLGNKDIENCAPMNHGGSYSFDFGGVKYVNAIHSSSFPDGSYGGNPGGFVVESEEGNFYYSGDTALTADMKLIGEATHLDFAVLCIGDVFTMGVQDAVRASNLIGCSKIVGVHYDTFDLIKIDHEAARAQFKASGKELHLIEIGGTVDL